MDIKQVGKELIKGKKYQLPEWCRFYIYSIEDVIMLKSVNTEPVIYNLHVSEILSDNWQEVGE